MSHCKIDHSEVCPIMEALPESQAGKHRHKCAGCAYDKGYEAGFIAATADAQERDTLVMSVLTTLAFAVNKALEDLTVKEH